MHVHNYINEIYWFCYIHTYSFGLIKMIEIMHLLGEKFLLVFINHIYFFYIIYYSIALFLYNYYSILIEWLNRSLIRTQYLLFIKPISICSLDYCSVIWAPDYEDHKNRLRNDQKNIKKPLYFRPIFIKILRLHIFIL